MLAIRFSGDAILVLYQPDRSFMPKDSPAAKKGEGAYADMPAMRNAAYRAVSEGVRALLDDYTVSAAELGNFGDPKDPASKEGIKLALHVAITAGPLQLMHVGGMNERWEVLMAGEAMQILGATADNAPTDHLCVEKNCFALLESDPAGLQFEVARLPAPNEDFVRVLNEVGPGASASAEQSDTTLGQRLVDGYSNDELNILRRYVTPLVQQAVHHRTMEAVSCFTEATVMFVGISGVDLGSQNHDLGMLWGQVVLSTVQV